MNRNKRICILTTGQPSTNPRVVKEADALAEASYQVHVIGCHWAAWADRFDGEVLKKKRWTFEYVGGSPREDRIRYGWTRVRHKAAQTAAPFFPHTPFLLERAVGRTASELRRAAAAYRADLYIAHYLPAASAAFHAAKAFHAKWGFDAEDFHSGQLDTREDKAAWKMVRAIEKEYLPHCDYLTASSTLIAQMYRDLFPHLSPVVIFNVFPVDLGIQENRSVSDADPLRLFWFSQTVGERRGLEDVLTAMGHLKNRSLELHLLGNPLDGYRQKLERLAGKLGLTKKQVNFHEPVSPDEVIRFAAQFHVGLAVEPSCDTNNDIALSNKIFAYLSAGDAVIATATSAQKALAEKIPGGVQLYPAGDAASLADGIQRWDENRALLADAQRAALKAGREIFSWDIEKKKLLSLVESIL